MFDAKIRISRDLQDRLKQAAAAAGAASVDEFAVTVLEREAEKLLASRARTDLSPEEVESITKKLSGLGYLE